MNQSSTESRFLEMRFGGGELGEVDLLEMKWGNSVPHSKKARSLHWWLWVISGLFCCGTVLARGGLQAVYNSQLCPAACALCTGPCHQATVPARTWSVTSRLSHMDRYALVLPSSVARLGGVYQSFALLSLQTCAHVHWGLLPPSQILTAPCLDCWPPFGLPPSSFSWLNSQYFYLPFTQPLLVFETKWKRPDSQPLQPTVLLIHPQKPLATFTPVPAFSSKQSSPFPDPLPSLCLMHSISPLTMAHLFSPIVILNGSLYIIFEKWGLFLLLWKFQHGDAERLRIPWTKSGSSI